MEDSLQVYAIHVMETELYSYIFGLESAFKDHLVQAPCLLQEVGHIQLGQVSHVLFHAEFSVFLTLHFPGLPSLYFFFFFNNYPFPDNLLAEAISCWQ